MGTVTLVEDLSNENARDLGLTGDLKDGFMDEAFNTSNRSLQAFMDVGLTAKGGDEYRIIALYDLSNAIPPDATTTAAVWWLYINSNSLQENVVLPYDHQIDRCTRTDWHEGYVTWDNYKESTAWTAGGGDMSTPVVLPTLDYDSGADAWWTADILTLVADARANRGDILNMIFRRITTVQAEDGYVRFYSKQGQTPPGPGVTVYAPHVRITYTLADKTLQVMVR